MGRYVEGQDRTQSVLFPERLDDWIHEDSTVRVIDVFVDELDLRKLGFERADPASTGRPGYSPATLLKIYVYGYLNRVQSSRRLETEAQRNLELLWLTGRLAPDFKTIADFRRDNGEAIRKVCKEFVLLCRRMKLFTDGIVAIDCSKFKAVMSPLSSFYKPATRFRVVVRCLAWSYGQRLTEGLRSTLSGRFRVAISLAARSAPGGGTASSPGREAVVGTAGQRSRDPGSAVPRTAAARACAGGRTERRLDGATREYARRRRPAPHTAHQPIALG